MDDCETCEGDGLIITGWDNGAYENIEDVCPDCEGTGKKQKETNSMKKINYRQWCENNIGETCWYSPEIDTENKLPPDHDEMCCQGDCDAFAGKEGYNKMMRQRQLEYMAEKGIEPLQ